MHATVIAAGAPLGEGAALWLVPIVIALALVTMLGLVSRGMTETSHRDVNHDPEDAHRGPLQGGFYTYRPGMYSHTLAPAEVAAEDRVLARP